jgi:hypothetical protein
MSQKGICQLASIPIRREDSDKSEMTSQLLFGETVDILEITDKWLMIRCHHDQYEGWVDKKQIQVLEEEKSVAIKTCTAPLLIVRNPEGGFNFLPAGSQLRIMSETTISCGNRTFECSREDLHNATQPAEIALGALMFLDTPYLWGGRTLMGLDCSGFTQLIYRMSGINIPRDAYQQAEIGELVAFIDEAQTGDLAFFDNAEGRVTHVGIVIHQQQSGEKTIIHASGKVRMDRLDHQGIFNIDSSTYSHQLRTIRRIR